MTSQCGFVEPGRKEGQAEVESSRGRAPRGAGVASCGESSRRGRDMPRAARQTGFAHAERGSLSSGCWGTFSSQQPC